VLTEVLAVTAVMKVLSTNLDVDGSRVLAMAVMTTAAVM